jgi:hypothetical protein
MSTECPLVPKGHNLNGADVDPLSDGEDYSYRIDEDGDEGLAPRVGGKTITKTGAKKQAQAQAQAPQAQAPAPVAVRPPSNGRAKHNQAMTRLLPRDRNLAWFADLEQPETMFNMINFVKPFHTEITVYATDKRRTVVTKNGDELVTGFRGLCIDAIDTTHVCMTIARLSANVCIDYKAGSDMDAVPGPLEADEAAVTVDIKTLHTVLKDVKANETMVMFVEENKSDLSVAVSDAGGETSSENLKTKTAPEIHEIMGELTFAFELSVPLNPLKTFIRRAGDLKADVVRITFHEIRDERGASEVRVLCLYAEGEDADMFRVLPVGTVKDLKDLADEDDDTAEDDAELGTEIFRQIEKVATLKGRSRSMHLLKTDDKVKIPVWPTDLAQHKELYNATFAHKYLHEMISQLCGTSQLSMFLGDSTTPLLMRFDLGKSDSYVAFALAARMEEEDEQ